MVPGLVLALGQMEWIVVQLRRPLVDPLVDVGLCLMLINCSLILFIFKHRRVFSLHQGVQQKLPDGLVSGVGLLLAGRRRQTGARREAQVAPPSEVSDPCRLVSPASDLHPNVISWVAIMSVVSKLPVILVSAYDIKVRGR